MKEQNIFDNEVFFEGYSKLRKNAVSANEIVEKPAFFSLCPDFTNQIVLDLGCGYGENCREFIKRGAKQVIGIDISEKMLAIANQEHQSEHIQFLHMSMNEIGAIDQKFDIILSSLAIHYIEDFDTLLKNINFLLKEGGTFVFSQEHPITTALPNDHYWTRDKQNEIEHYNLMDYSLEGKREVHWMVDGIIKYHRTFSSILNSLLAAGFTICKILEPMPSKEVMTQYPAFKRYYFKPDFLLIRAEKKDKISTKS